MGEEHPAEARSAFGQQAEPVKPPDKNHGLLRKLCVQRMHIIMCYT